MGADSLEDFLRLPFSFLFSTFDLPRDVGLESSLSQLRIVLVENVHQIGDVTRCQSQRLDLRQFRIRWYIRNTSAQSSKRRIDTVGPSSFLPVRTDSPLDRPNTWHRPIIDCVSGREKKRKLVVGHVEVGGSGMGVDVWAESHLVCTPRGRQRGVVRTCRRRVLRVEHEVLEVGDA